MKSILMTFLAVILFSPLPGLASIKKGNGGNILLCRDSQNITLDYFEMNELHHFRYAYDLLSNSDFFRAIEQRLQRVNPAWVLKFHSIVESLDSSVFYTSAMGLGVIDDVFAVFIPEQCELTQTAIQRSNRIIISRPLFDRLSLDQQNILVLHEVIYSLMLSERNLFDSRPVRALVSLLISDDLIHMNLEETLSFIKKHDILLTNGNRK